MTLSKITINNSVRYVSKEDHSHSERTLPISKESDSKPNTRKKKASNLKLSQKNKKFSENKTAEEDFRIIKCITNCYF